MDSLPQDIIDHIISYLTPRKKKPQRTPDKDEEALPPLAPLAGAISSPVQYAVERQTFKNIKITSEELLEFERFLTPRRRCLLNGLAFTVILPTYDGEAAQRPESPEERAANDECYTEAISPLFRILKSWEVEDPDSVTYRLALTITHPHSPSDGSKPQTLGPGGAVPHPMKRSIRHGRYLHSYINLNHPESLPALQRVKRLNMPRPEEKAACRNVYPKVPMLLASRLPNLEKIDVTVDDDQKRFPELRRQNRYEMAEAIREVSLPSLKRARILFAQERYRDEFVVPPVLHDAAIPDPLSSALHGLSLNLMTLEISGVFDPSLLRPLQGLSGTPWPNLKTLDISLLPTTPSGDWYFTGDDNVPRARISRAALPTPCKYSELHREKFSFLDEELYAGVQPRNVFRNQVKEDTLIPFLEAYADALSAMPKLFSAVFDCELEEDSLHEGCFTITYFAPCFGARKLSPGQICPKCFRGTARQLVTSLFDWKKHRGLADKLRKIQENIHDAPMVDKDIAAFVEEHAEVEDEEESGEEER